MKNDPIPTRSVAPNPAKRGVSKFDLTVTREQKHPFGTMRDGVAEKSLLASREEFSSREKGAGDQ